MTTPTPDGIAAAVTAYGQAQYAAGRADQALADQQTVASLNAQIAALQQQLATMTADDQAQKAEVAELEAELAALQPKVLYGSGFGGWFQTLHETKQNAYTRIVAALAGQKGYLPVARLFGGMPNYVDSRTVLFWDTGSGVSDAQAQALDARGPGQLLSVVHEPNKYDAISPAAWVPSQQVAAAKLANYPNVSLVPTLEGKGFISARNPPVPAQAYFDALTAAGVEFDYIGADLYQWGKDDASADTAQDVLGEAIALARTLGKRLVIGELGARRPNPPYTPGITDAARAKFLTDVIALCDANADVVHAVMLFESDNGSANMIPWPITHPTNANYSPLAVAAWAPACNR